MPPTPSSRRAAEPPILMAVLGLPSRRADHRARPCTGCRAGRKRERRAAVLWRGLLGLSELEKPAALRHRGDVCFACGAHQLHVGVTQDFSPATKAHPALRVRLTEPDLIAERLLAAGSMVQWDEAITDTRRFYTADPWAIASS